MTRANCPFEPGNRVWAYCRDSGGDEQQDSVSSQRRAIEEYCREHNLVLVHVFIDEARPGSTTVGRDGLEDLLYLSRASSSGASRAWPAGSWTRSSSRATCARGSTCSTR
jgi:hypothetical protein